MAYAAYTTTRRNLAALERARWRIMLSPATGLNSYGLPYALDNGAWSAFATGAPWDEEAFVRALTTHGAGADFVAVPDIVEGGAESLARSCAWLPRVLDRAPLALIPVQDGMTETDIAPLLAERVGIFVGGSTGWKERSMSMWGALARTHGTRCHVGRVNTIRRIRLCAAAGATSFDGSSVSRYAINLPKLERARWQPDLFAGVRP